MGIHDLNNDAKDLIGRYSERHPVEPGELVRDIRAWTDATLPAQEFLRDAIPQQAQTSFAESPFNLMWKSVESFQEEQAARTGEPEKISVMDRVLNVSGVQTLLQGLEYSYTHFVDPAGTLFAEAVAGQIPGKQDLERRMDEAREAARERGEGWLGREQAAVAAGREAPLPTVDVSLPFTITFPDWLAGDRTFKDFQLGVRGLSELAVTLPFDIAGAKLLAPPLRAIIKNVRHSKAPYMGMAEGTPEWISLWRKNPKLQSEMAEYASRMEQGLPTNNLKATVPPEVKPGSALDEAFKIMDAAEVAKPGIIPKLKSAWLRWKEETTDQFAGIEELERSVRKEWKKKFGEEIPLDMRATVTISNLPGGISAGATRATEAISAMQRTLGSGIHRKYVGVYLRTRHLMDAALLKGPERVIAGSIKGVAGAQKILDDMFDALGPERFSRVVSASRVIRDFYDEFLDENVSAGLISTDLAATLRKTHPWYNPLAYQKLAAAGQGSGAKTLSVNRSNLKAMGDVGLEISTENPLQTIYRVAVQHEMLVRRNNAARQIIQLARSHPETAALVKKVSIVRKVAQQHDEAIFRPAKGDIKGTLSYLENGKRVVYEVPEFIEREAKGLAIGGFGTWEKIGRVVNALPRAVLTTYNPTFIAGQTMFDAMTVATINGVMPHRVLTSLLASLKNIVKSDPVVRQMIRTGGDVMGYYGVDPRDVLRKIEKGGNIALRSEGDVLRFLARPWDAVKEIGHAFEMAPRRAVFKRELDKGTPAAVASQMARRSTVDFARGGTAIRTANSLFLYLNPAVQGAILPLRAVQNSWTARVGLSSHFLAATGAYAWNRQFPEWHDMDAKTKYGSFGIMLPSNEYDEHGNKVPHYIAIIPNTREFAAFLGGTTYTLALLDKEAPESLPQFLEAMVPELNPVESITSVGGLPFMGKRPSPPIPTYFGETATELALNRDFYFQRDIVPSELQGLPPKEQFDEYTSETARRLGSWFNFSPMKIDHIIRVGTVRDIIAGADAALRVFNEGEDPEVEGLVSMLAELPERYAAEEVQTIRRTLLNDMSAELRKNVLEAERTPEPAIPFISTMKRRFWRQSQGQIYRASMEQAAQKRGLPSEQVSDALRLLGSYSEELQASQETLDSNFEQGIIDGKEWREGRKTNQFLYQGALATVGITMPSVEAMLSDPQARAAFFDDVYTMLGQAPDTRSKGELLYATFRSIPVKELTSGQPDWNQYFALQSEFIGGLSEEEQGLLKAERESRMTPFEREVWFRPSEQFKTYWDIHKRLLDNDPHRIQLYEKWNRETTGIDRDRAVHQNPWLRWVEVMVAQEKEQMRLDPALGPELEEFLLRFGYIDEAKWDSVSNRRFEIVPKRRETVAELNPTP